MSDGAAAVEEPRRRGLPPAVKYIIGNEACERFSFYGMSTILVPYMQNTLGWGHQAAEGVFHKFVAAAYAATVIGGLLSDRFFGRYKTILWLSYGYVLGHAVLAGGDLFPSFRVAALYLGMGLVAMGQGGVKPNLSAFVGDQFRKDEAHLLDRVYSWFYVAINLGSAASQIATPWLLAGCAIGATALCKDSATAWGFGVPGLLMALSLVIYLSGRKLYVKVPPLGRDPHSFGAVLATMLSKGQAAARSAHGDEAVQGAHAVFRIALFFLPIAIFWALYFQYGSSWFNQAEQMNRELWGLHIESGQMESLNALLVLVMVPTFAYGVYPLAEKLGLRPTLTRRMVAGMFITVPGFLAAAMIQRWIEAGQHPHLAWQVIQYVLIAISETLISVTALEFAYTQAPKSMKGTIMSFWFLTIGLGSYLTALVTEHVQFATRTNYFLFWAGLMAAAAAVFAVIATNYRSVAFQAAPSAGKA